MNPVPDKTLRWLYTSLTSEYHDPDRAYSDIAQTLSHYTSLSPRTEVHTFENGSSSLLLLLQGTLPVSFKGTIYRFPISLWVPHSYPRESPMIYITPSQGMVVRPGQHVSMDGRVYHPYLAQWSNHWDKSNILDLLLVLSDIFAKEPPVISRQHQGQPQQRLPVKDMATASLTQPPLPEEGRRSLHGPPQTYSQQILPPRPSKESTRNGLNSRTRNSHLGAESSPSVPSLPPKPANMAQPSASEMGNTLAIHTSREGWLPSQTTNEKWSRSGPPLRPLPRQPVQPVNGQTHSALWSDPRPGQHGSPYPQYQQQQVNLRPPQRPFRGYPGPQPPLQLSYQQNPQQQSSGPQQDRLLPQQMAPKLKQPVADLMSSPLETILSSESGQPSSGIAPPIPPNPEKDALLNALSHALRTQLQQTIAQNTAALNSLQAQNGALLQAYQNMQSEMSQLQQLDAMLKSNEKILHNAMRDADHVMETVGQREIPAVDDVLVAPTVVGEQLYGLVADERSIADAMFMLTRALDKGRVGGDVFLKQTRSLAREQFLKKALIKKIAIGMGLAMDG